MFITYHHRIWVVSFIRGPEDPADRCLDVSAVWSASNTSGRLTPFCGEYPLKKVKGKLQGNES